jgi:biotin-dependent carboxylase-like uncharacterized protein
MIEILDPGALSTVQDAGRGGQRRFGVGTAGAMDQLALAAGNRMLGNPPAAAGIEVPVLPFQIRFLRDMDFALTGADAGAELDGASLPPWWTRRARAGQVLTLGGGGTGFRAGARAYLLVGGGVDVPLVLGSRSTQLRGQFGGHHGRALLRGDILPVGPMDAPLGQVAAHSPAFLDQGFGVVPASVALPDSAFFEAAAASTPQPTAMRVVVAAEYEDFEAASVQAFWNTDWKISAQSDRYGYRLAGVPLALREPVETRSHGIVPGVVQVPHSGQPIIQMRDAQPSGGYPKIGTVIEADLWRLGQARAGSRIRFVRCTYAQAVAALQPVADYLARLGRLCTLYRQMHG